MTAGTVIGNVLVPLLVLLAAWLMPSLTSPTLPFGVRVPAAMAHAPVIARERAAYRWWVGGAGGALLVVWGVLTAVAGASLPEGAPASLAVLAVSAVAMVRAHRAIRAVKRREGWYGGLRQAVVADTALRTEPQRFPWRWSLPALVVTGATLAAGVARYPELPARLPVHYDGQGRVDRFAATTIGSAFAAVIAQIAVTAFAVLLLHLAFRARPDLDPARPAASAARHRRFLGLTAAAVLLLIACVDVSLGLVAWQSWSGALAVAPAALLAPVGVGLLIVLAVALRTGQGGSRLGVDGVNGADGQDGGRRGPDAAPVAPDDDAHWYGGLVYANRRDPAVLVPKRFGIGWTVNFGNPRSLLLLLPLLVLAVLLPLLVH